jgi:hypothetical protein
MNDRLDGWKEIAGHLGRNIRTVQRWHVHRGMPVYRVPGGRSGSVYALRSEIEEWLRSPRAVDRDEDEDDTGEVPAPAAGEVADVAGSPPSAGQRWSRGLRLVVALGAALVFGIFLGQLRPWSRRPVAIGSRACSFAVDPIAGSVPHVGGRLSISVTGASGCEWGAFVPVPWMRLDPEAGVGSATPVLALPGNHTTSERVATLQVAGIPVRVVQGANPRGCQSTPGPGFVKDGYRYRITARPAWGTENLLAVARAEGGEAAEGFGWNDLVALLDGHPEDGVRFAREVGMYQHSWESTQFTGPCFNYWLIKNDGEPEFATYHAGMKGPDYKSYKSINGDQFDLGRWNQQNQVLYRVPEPGGAAGRAPATR